MTPLLRFLKRWREKWLGTWREGPDPPNRLWDMVVMFANAHPQATRLEWADFAAHHAAEAYQQGWLRGYEYVERDADWHRFVHDADPDRAADILDPGWREESEPLALEEPAAVVPAQEPTASELIDHLMKVVRRQDERAGR